MPDNTSNIIMWGGLFVLLLLIIAIILAAMIPKKAQPVRLIRGWDCEPQKGCVGIVNENIRPQYTNLGSCMDTCHT